MSDKTSILFRALASDHGLVVETSDPNLLRQQLYKIRREDMSSFGTLSFVISPARPDNELWIVKNAQTEE